MNRDFCSRLTLPVIFTGLCLITGAPVRGEQWTLNDKLVAVDGNPSIPLRLVTKPGAKICKERNMKEVIASPAAFSVLYVSQNKSGNTQVYQVARDSGESLGFIDATQVLEWKQSLCLKFDSLNERKPVLMFKDSGPLTGLAAKDAAQRASLAKSWYSTVEGLSGDYTVPDDFPIISMEPKRGVDMKRSFYLMPILNHVALTMDDTDALAVQVSIASKTGSRGATDLKDKDFVQGATQETDMTDAKNAPVEIVYCFDLTTSMQPYLDISVDLARKVSSALASAPGAAERIKFGLWGYRDHGPEAQGFVVQAFTPQPVEIQQFNMALSQAKATGKTGGDVPEDLLGGFAQASQHGFANENAIRVLVLIGDAPGHDSPGDQRNSSGMPVYQLRQLASERGVKVYSMLIMDPRYQQFHSAAQAQFSAFAMNPGTSAGMGQGSFMQLQLSENGNNNQVFNAAADQLYRGLMQAVVNAGDATKQEEAKKRYSEEDRMLSEEAKRVQQEAEVVVNDLFRAAIVEWIARNSKDVKPPNDITAWICDHDLIDAARTSVSTCVLLTRNELDHLKQALNIVIEAGLEGQATGKEFFSCIQNVAATASVLPTQLGNMKEMKTLGDLKLLPGFLQGLPYKSKLLNMSNEEWSSMPPTRQQKILDDLQGLIDAYKVIYADNEQWISLTENKGVEDSMMVAAVPLVLLP